MAQATVMVSKNAREADTVVVVVALAEIIFPARLITAATVEDDTAIVCVAAFLKERTDAQDTAAVFAAPFIKANELEQVTVTA